MAKSKIPLKTGSALPEECTPVDWLPPTALKADSGKIAQAEGASADLGTSAGKEGNRFPIQKGMLLLADRKQKYKDAFTKFGLTVCDDEEHKFASAYAPLRLSLGASLSDLQVYLVGRDLVDASPPTVSVYSYWRIVLERIIDYAKRNTPSKKHIVVLGTPYSKMGPLITNILRPVMPAGYTAFAYDQGDPSHTVSDYFASIESATPLSTAVVVVADVFVDFVNPADAPFAISFANTMVANATVLRTMLKSGCSLMAWSEIITAKDPGGEYGPWNDQKPLILGWKWARSVFPGLVPLCQFELHADFTLTNVANSFFANTGADSLVKGDDTAQSGFSSALPVGLMPMVMGGADRIIDIGGLFVE
jgi:hypothetical protein